MATFMSVEPSATSRDAEIAEYLSYAKINPELDAILKNSPSAPPFHGDVVRFRAEHEAQKKAFSAQTPQPTDVIERDSTISARDGHAIPIRIYSPAHPPASGSPLMVVIHGGGFCVGGLLNEEPACRLATQRHGMVCVNIDYRLAPEHPFPVPVNDVWDATQHIAANATTLYKADPSKGFIVMGVSAGGNMTDVVGHLARDTGLSPPITGLLEIVPRLMNKEVVPGKYQHLYLAEDQNQDVPALDRNTMNFFQDNHKPDAKSPLYAPFINEKGHSGLPPIFLQVCGLDPLRDDALIYAKHLREETHVKTKLKVYPGLPHVFWAIWPKMASSKTFVEETQQGITWLLAGGNGP